MNGGAHISQEDLALYAMQALRGDELEQVLAHLPTCAECRDELSAIAGDLVAVGASVEQLPVPDRARQRFMESIASDIRPESIASPAAMPATSTRTPRAIPWVPWAIAAALALTAGGLGMKVKALHEQLQRQSVEVARSTDENVHSQRVMKLLLEPSAQRVTLTTSKTPVEPVGHTIYLADRGELIFQGNNLKELPPDKTYELWLIPSSGTAPIPAGLFRPDQKGDASVIMPPLPVGVTAKAFGVTVERAEGSGTPTLPILLSGAPAPQGGE